MLISRRSGRFQCMDADQTVRERERKGDRERMKKGRTKTCSGWGWVLHLGEGYYIVAMGNNRGLCTVAMVTRRGGLQEAGQSGRI